MHSLHECVSLQRLHIVECDCDAACRLEVLEALVLRIEQYGAETAVTAVVLVCISLEVDLNLAHALQIVYYRTLGALNLVVEVVLAAGCHTGGREVTDGTIFILNQESDEVVVLDLAHLGAACLDRTLRNDDGLHAEHLAHVAHDHLGNAQQMAAQVAECARACQLVDVTPCNRNGRIEQHILIVSSVYAHDLAQLAGLDELCNVLVCRVHDVGETAVVDYALFLGQISQLAGLLRGQRQRLLAENMLAVLESSLCHLVVHAVRGCNVHQIDFGIGNNVHPVGGVAVVAHVLRELCYCILADVAYQLKYRHIIAEDHACVVECGGVGLAHPAGADQTDFNFLAHKYLLLLNDRKVSCLSVVPMIS